MNSISWFLYISGVVGNLSVLAGGLPIIGSIAAIVLAAVWGVTSLDGDKNAPAIGRVFKRTVGATIGLWFLAALLPSTNTMYAIAASEVGEKIAKTEAAQVVAKEAYEGLRAWLKKQTEAAK